MECTCSTSAWMKLLHRVCSRKNLLHVLSYPRSTKLSPSCWSTAQEKYCHKLVIPCAHGAFSKQMRGTSRITRPTSLHQGFQLVSGTHKLGNVFKFLFLYFPWNASLHTIVDLNLFLHKLSLFFLAFMALTHHSCHCYKLFVVVASMVAEDTNCKCQLLPVTPRNKGTGEGEVIKALSPSYQDIFFPNSLSSLGLLLFTFLQFLPDPIGNAHGSV